MKRKEYFGIELPLEGRQRHAERIAIAWALHPKTDQPQGWIAEALGLRTAANVSQQVRRFQKETLEVPSTTDKKPALANWVDLVKNC